MAKKTLSSIKQCPIDFLYLWASDDFISQLGSKSKIISKKKYNQYQTLWKTMVENVGGKTAAEYQEIYKQWTSEIAQAIQDTYGKTPAEILQLLAMGEEVLGKNFRKGVYGVGDAAQYTFSQDSNVTVDSSTGKILVGGTAVEATPIYGQGGQITGYSYVAGGNQYQSSYNGSSYVAFSYSNSDGVQTANGGAFNASQAGFWQNAQNYLPIIESVLSWVSSIVNAYFPNRTVLTEQVTVPQQTEWVDKDTSGTSRLLIAGGLAAVGLVLAASDKPKKTKKSK